MTRLLRIDFKGALYPATSRRNTRQAIFLTGEDFADFLFCLMFCGKKLSLHITCRLSNEQSS